jgi:hypothetical protein
MRARMEADEAHAEADAHAAVGVRGGIGASGEVGGVDGGAEGAGLSLSQPQPSLSMSQPQPSLSMSQGLSLSQPQPSLLAPTSMHAEMRRMDVSGSESSIERGSASLLPHQHPNSNSTFPPAPPPGGGGGNATDWAEAVSGKRGGRGRSKRESEAESIMYPPTLLEAIGELQPPAFPLCHQ